MSTIDGYVHDEGGQVVDIRNPAFGAKGNTLMKTGGSISSGTTAFAATSATFASTDVGKVITVQGAGASGAVLSTTISGYTDSTHVTLANAAGTTVSGAAFAFGTDDTAAIVAAITAAGARGSVYAPPGIYMVRGSQNSNGPIVVTSAGGLIGAGGNPASPGTTFLCGDSTAGLVTAGPATYQRFCCHGNNIATTPLQNGTIVSGQATTSGSRSTFFDVWATGSAGTGWTIYGAQGNSYHDCGSTKNALDGLYIDGGAGGLGFWNWTESASSRYGISAATSVTGGAGTRVDRTEGIRFFGGSLTSASGGPSGTSKVRLRGAYNWKLLDMRIAGDNLTGHTVDLDQSAGDTLDFSGCRISATPITGSPGHACIAVNSSPPGGAAKLPFLLTGRVRFTAGDTSVYLAGAGNYLYPALDWVIDATTNGPVAASGLNGIDTLLAGRAGPWVSVSLSSPWSGSVSYRFDSLGHVELKGTLTSSSGSGGTIFTLPAGYRPGGGSGPTMQFPVALSNGVASVTVAGNGVVTGPAPGTATVYLDGIRFPVD